VLVSLTVPYLFPNLLTTRFSSTSLTNQTRKQREMREVATSSPARKKLRVRGCRCGAVTPEKKGARLRGMPMVVVDRHRISFG
jgi:hypothetical protein